MIYESIAVLFHNARQLEKEQKIKGENVEITLDIEQVRKGLIENCYSLQVKLELLNVDLASLVTQSNESSDSQEGIDNEDEQDDSIKQILNQILQGENEMKKTLSLHMPQVNQLEQVQEEEIMVKRDSE